MSQKHNKLKEDITYELGQIQKVVNTIEELRKEIKGEAPDTTQKAAMGTHLMNFYSGIENIFKRVAKDYYGFFPTGDAWHKELLELSGQGFKDKKAIVDQNTINSLSDYLGFRHLFIHGYSFVLDWNIMNPLINNIDNIWKNIKLQIENFLKYL